MNINIFKKNGIKASFSNGVATKTHFVSPCILLEAILRPTLRYKSEKLFLKEYLKKIGKSNKKDMTNIEYLEYMNQSDKNGETREYTEWRKTNRKKIEVIKKLIDDFNISNNSKTKRKITILNFDGGKIRICSGDQSDLAFKKRSKLKIADKKSLLSAMVQELESFVSFVKEKI